jgi:RNA polymerase sigma factor (sigma-70 family)
MPVLTPHLLRHLHRLASPAELPDDAALLERFLHGRDEAVFAALVGRHGPLVWGVCRRLLADLHAAEDAFQATFLVLARKAHTVRPPEALAGWLFGVARRTALKARARRPAPPPLPEEAVSPGARPDVLDELTARELLTILDDEVERLPGIYRLPVVLCCLEGRTREEAARQLGWTEGSVKGRLERGRKLLHARLAKRGLVLPAVLGAVEVARGTSGVLTGLAACTVRVASTGVESAGVTALAEAVLKGSVSVRWNLAVVLLFSLGAAALGAGVLTQPPPEKEQAGQIAESPVRQKEREPSKDLYGDPLQPGAVARLGTVRFRHTSWVQAIACSPDGKLLATADGDVIRCWDMATGKEARPYRGHKNNVHCLAYSADGKFLASGSSDKTIRLWDVTTGKELRRFEGHQEKKQEVSATPVSHVFFTPDGKRLVSTGADDTIRLWDVATGKELRRFEGHREHVWTIALAADGKTLAAFSKKPSGRNQPGEVRLWDVATGKTLRHWPLPDDTALDVFSPDLRFFVTCYRDASGPQILKLWDVQTGNVVRSLPVCSFRVAFSADGNTLVSGGDNKMFRLWDVNTGKELRQYENPHPSFASSVMLGPNGKTLISWGFKNAIHFVDLTTGKETRRFAGHDRAVSAVAFSPDGKLVASGEGGEVHLWDRAAQKRIHRVAGLREYVTAVAFAPDGKTLLSGSANGMTYVGDVRSGRVIKSLGTPGSIMAFSADGKTAVTCGRSASGLLLWDVTTGKPLRQLTEPNELWHPFSVVFSPDDKVLAAESGFSVRLWDVATGKELPTLGKHARVVNRVTFSPGGRLLAAVEWFDTIHLWEMATGRERLVVNTGGNVTAIAFSPDGRFLAVANSGSYRRPAKNGTGTGNEECDKVLLVDLASGKVVHRFGSHRGGVVCLAFSPDGTLLASGGGRHDHPRLGRGLRAAARAAGNAFARRIAGVVGRPLRRGRRQGTPGGVDIAAGAGAKRPLLARARASGPGERTPGGGPVAG